MLAEVSSREIAEWQAYARWLDEQHTNAESKGRQPASRAPTARSMSGDVVIGEVPGSRAPGEPPPDIGIDGIEIPPATLWE